MKRTLTPARWLWVVALLAAWMAALTPLPAAAQDKFNDGIRYLYVQPGQTLHNIVRRLYPEKKKQWSRIRSDIVRLNPHAFPNGKASSMRAGVKLELPVKQVVKPTPARPRAPMQVGEVVAARGRTLAVGPNMLSRKLAAGKPVFLGDKLVTGEDGFMRVRMIDNAQLDIRCFSVMVIEEYDLQSTSRTSIINLLQGSLRKITGEIGKFGEDVYILKTPVASVGVRGTEYALRVFQSKGCDGSADTDEDALYLKVIQGLVDVENKAAKTAVAKGDTLYIPLPDTKPVDKPVPNDVLMVEDAKEEESSFWWYVLGGLALLALL